MSKSKIPKDVDEYIAAAPEATRAKLAQLRKMIKTTAPQAEEVISYHMPYKHNGHFVSFAAYKDHVPLPNGRTDGIPRITSSTSQVTG